MSHLPSGRERRRLGLDVRITRRDFVNGVLIGAGTVMLGASSRDAAAAAEVAGRGAASEPARAIRGAGEDTFTGYGGVGDYARANGNTWPVVQAAHRCAMGNTTRQPWLTRKPPGNLTSWSWAEVLRA